MEDVNENTEAETPAETKPEVPALDVPFSGSHNKTAGSITFIHTNGKSYTILKSNRGFEKALELLGAIDKTDPGGDEEKKLREELYDLTIPASRITKMSLGEVRIENGKIMWRDQLVHNVVGDRILWMLDHDEDPKVMLRFLDNLMQNPSHRSVQETFRFLESNQMAISRSGMILAYKRVDDEFKSMHANVDGTKMDNTPGNVVTMPRNEVDDDSNRTCSTGLHVAAMSYLPHYWGDRVVICEIHPKDVVSIPRDYNDAKMRVCEYKVLRELAKDEGDVLAEKPVWEAEVAA